MVNLGYQGLSIGRITAWTSQDVATIMRAIVVLMKGQADHHQDRKSREGYVAWRNTKEPPSSRVLVIQRHLVPRDQQRRCYSHSVVFYQNQSLFSNPSSLTLSIFVL